jgi:hypothetical protein
MSVLKCEDCGDIQELENDICRAVCLKCRGIMNPLTTKDIREELQRQIDRCHRSSGYPPAAQEVQNVIDFLGGKLQVKQGDDIGGVCYYITLLSLERQMQED